MRTLIVNVTEGMKEYASGLIREERGLDLSSATFQVGIGGHDTNNLPSAWTTPDEDVVVASNCRRIGKLIDSSVPVGVHWVWVKVTDNPEIVPMRIDISVVVK